MKRLVFLALALGLVGTAVAQPSGLSRPGLVHDTESGLLVLYGGTQATAEPYGETWVFDLATSMWELRSPEVSPPPIHEHVLAYDAASDLVVLWGGYTAEGENLDLWTYDANTNRWAQIEQDPATIPPGRVFAEAEYHPGIDRIVVNGGWDRATGPNLADTWLLDIESGTWEEVDASPAPTTRLDYALAHDPASGLLVLFGGVTEEVAQGAEDVDRVWTFDGETMTWTERAAIEGPTNTAYGDVAALGTSGHLLYYGGGSFGSDEAWLYDVQEHAWTQIDAPAPGARHRHVMVAGPEGSVILFGGLVGFRSDSAQNDVWQFDPTSEAWVSP